MAWNRSMIECTHAVWTFKYTNGFVVTLRGPFSCHLVAMPNAAIRFENLTFDANLHDKYLSVEGIVGHPTSPPTSLAGGLGPDVEDDRQSEEPRQYFDHASIPAEPVNAFGIPQATMRCLEVSDRHFPSPWH